MVNIGIINLMSDKLSTEENFEMIFNSSEVNVEYLYFKSHHNRSHFDYQANHYIPIDQHTYQQFDGFIFTGAPIDHIAFNDIDYIDEFRDLVHTLYQHNIPTLYLCWSAMASMNTLYHIEKYPLDKKIFGIFSNHLVTHHPMVQGFSTTFYAPHARYYDIKIRALMNLSSIQVLSKTIDNHPTFWVDENHHAIYSLSHIEYDPMSLVKEYQREHLGKKEHAIFPILHTDKEQKLIFNWKKEQKLFFDNFISLVKENHNDYK